MKNKHSFGKMLVIILCVAVVTIFALVKSGFTPQFLIDYQNNFKRNISGICHRLNIELPLGVQLYLDEMTEPEPVQLMTPASEERESLAYPDYEQEIEEEKEGNITLTVKKKEEQPKDLPTAFLSAENSVFSSYEGDIICANATVYAKFNANAKQLWEQDIQMQNPMLTVAGEYVLINETGGKKISLYKGKKLLFITETEGNIVTADVSKKGDVVAVTDKEFYKGQVVVFNKKGTKVFAWDSGSYSILDASISADRNVAISLLSTDSGVDSIVSLYDIKNGKQIFETEPFIDTLIFDVGFDGNNVLAVADDSFISLSAKGKVKNEYNFDGRRLKQYQKAENKDIALLFDNAGTGEIVILKPNGKECGVLKTQGIPDAISIKSKTIAYNNGRQAVLSNYSGKKVLVADCNSDIKQLCITGSNKLFCVYGSSVQEKKLEKKKKTNDIFDNQQENADEQEGN